MRCLLCRQSKLTVWILTWFVSWNNYRYLHGISALLAWKWWSVKCIVYCHTSIGNNSNRRYRVTGFNLAAKTSISTYVHFYFLISSIAPIPKPTRLGMLPWLCQELPSTTTAAFKGWRFRALQILAVLAFHEPRKGRGTKFKRGVVLVGTFSSVCSELLEIIKRGWHREGSFCKWT